MNAAQLLAFDKRAAAVGEALWPCTVTLAGTDYPAHAPAPRVTRLEDQGGVEIVADLHVRIRKAVLETAPAIEQELTAHERTWWVREVRANDADACWVIRCEAKN